ncbi:YihY family inner membrane protein [Niveibacterium sp. 24ML]|uniref:YihY family inner membrane protein n=1 Tax=Niveibacterium sp. 24ML TaxID=2985512 RepID=UPI00226E48F0|nr:YihY family inner membrane protein [Niveibacterium sp. 24ML]MCX9157609.1 YihY family inner membrane protein [Niveibacterium sp. 24ML]
MHEIRRFVGLLVERFSEVRGSLVAGSLTFTTLLSLVPLVAVSVTVIGQLPMFAQLGATLKIFLLTNLLPDKAGKVIATYAIQFSQKAENLTLFGGIALIATAVLLLMTVDRAFNAIWQIRRPRPLWSRIALFWLTLTFGPIVLAASIAATTFAITASLGAMDEPAWLRGFMLRSALPVLLFSALFSYLFFAMPNRKIDRVHAMIGGLFAGVGIVVLQRLLGVYFSRFPSYTLLYGTFSAIPIFLVWLYSTWLVILIGAMISAVIPDFLARRNVLPPSAAGRLYASLRLVGVLDAAQRDRRVASLSALAAGSRQRIEETEAMLESMREAGWVSESDEGGWLLVGSAGSIDPAMLFSRFVIAADEIEGLSRGDADDAARASYEAITRVNEALRAKALAQIG